MFVDMYMYMCLCEKFPPFEKFQSFNELKLFENLIFF